MKRLSPRNEFVLDNPLLLVGHERSVFAAADFLKSKESFTNFIGGDTRFCVVDSEFEKTAIQEFRLQGGGLRVGEAAVGSFNSEDSYCGVFARCEHVEIQSICRGPFDQCFRAIAPLQSEGWSDDLLGRSSRSEGCREKARDKCPPEGEVEPAGDCALHGKIFPQLVPNRKSRPIDTQKGFALVEATLAMSLLSVVGLILLTLSLNIVYPRQYTLQQVLSDAHMTFERARAERIPFETLTGDTSPWPVFPSVATEEVVIGKLPGGKEVKGEVSRTRVADENNYPSDGDANSVGTVASNPAAMKIWRVQSVLKYTISQRTYVKSRTIVRAQ